MNNQEIIKENKELKDYTDQELTNELARRIENYSLDLFCLIYPLSAVACQYIKSYEAERKKLEENKPID